MWSSAFLHRARCSSSRRPEARTRSAIRSCAPAHHADRARSARSESPRLRSRWKARDSEDSHEDEADRSWGQSSGGIEDPQRGSPPRQERRAPGPRDAADSRPHTRREAATATVSPHASSTASPIGATMVQRPGVHREAVDRAVEHDPLRVDRGPDVAGDPRRQDRHRGPPRQRRRWSSSRSRRRWSADAHARRLAERRQVDQLCVVPEDPTPALRGRVGQSVDPADPRRRDRSAEFCVRCSARTAMPNSSITPGCAVNLIKPQPRCSPRRRAGVAEGVDPRGLSDQLRRPRVAERERLGVVQTISSRIGQSGPNGALNGSTDPLGPTVCRERTEHLLRRVVVVAAGNPKTLETLPGR